MGKTVVLILALAIAGCSATGGGSFCKVMTDENGQPILRPTESDVAAVSRELAEGLVTVLETGERLGCWKAPQR